MCIATHHPPHVHQEYACIYFVLSRALTRPSFPPLSMLQVYDVVKKEAHNATTVSMFRPYFRLNDQCETGYNVCLQLKPVYCDLHLQTDQDNMMCIPSQLKQAIDVCNQESSFEKYKICDGAFEWCNEGAPAMSVLLKIDWLSRRCLEKAIGKECGLRHRCFQQCLQERQSGECNFFAITRDHCRTFSTLDGTGFSSSSCGPWKIYQMKCVGGPCDDLDERASTAASTVKAEDFTTVSGYVACVHFFPTH